MTGGLNLANVGYDPTEQGTQYTGIKAGPDQQLAAGMYDPNNNYVPGAPALQAAETTVPSALNALDAVQGPPMPTDMALAALPDPSSFLDPKTGMIKGLSPMSASTQAAYDAPLNSTYANNPLGFQDARRGTVAGALAGALGYGTEAYGPHDPSVTGQVTTPGVNYGNLSATPAPDQQQQQQQVGAFGTLGQPTGLTAQAAAADPNSFEGKVAAALGASVNPGGYGTPTGQNPADAAQGLPSSPDAVQGDVQAPAPSDPYNLLGRPSDQLTAQPDQTVPTPPTKPASIASYQALNTDYMNKPGYAELQGYGAPPAYTGVRAVDLENFANWLGQVPGYQNMPYAGRMALAGVWNAESKLGTQQNEIGGQGNGLGQWTSPDRKSDFQTSLGDNASDIGAQASFAMKEMSTPGSGYAPSFNALQNATNPQAAFDTVKDNYEAPGKPGQYPANRNSLGSLW
jgi:hypothetical protein